MSVSGGKIIAPVTIADVKSVLGASDNDLAALCKHSSINIWAKYKPVKRVGVVSTTSQWDYTNNCWKSNADWFQGEPTYIQTQTPPSCVCGLTVYETTDLDDIISKTTGGMNGWLYSRPTGSLNNAPYRLTDFAQYNHNAVKAVDDVTCTSQVKQYGFFNASATIAVSGSDNVAIADFGTLMYFGVFLIKSNVTQSKSNIVAMGTDSTLGGSGVVVQSMPSGIDLATYKVYPFFSSNPRTFAVGSSMGVGTKFWTVPYGRVMTMKYVSPTEACGIAPSAKWSNSSHSAMKIWVKNTSSSARTVTIYLRRSGRNESQSAISPDEKTIVSGQSIASGSTYTNNTTTIPTPYNTQYNYHIIVVCTSVSPNVSFDVAIMGTVDPDPTPTTGI